MPGKEGTFTHDVPHVTVGQAGPQPVARVDGNVVVGAIW